MTLLAWPDSRGMVIAMADAPGMTAEQDRADVARVLRGDDEAFAALVDRHQSRLRGFLAAMVGASEADDLAQEAFLRAWSALARYDPTYPFRGWLLVIAGRLAANHLAKRRPQALGEHEPAAPPMNVADDDLTERLEAALTTLSPDDRLLYELRYRQDLPIAELARHLAITANAAKVRLHRLRGRLADMLGVPDTEGDFHD